MIFRNQNLKLHTIHPSLSCDRTECDKMECDKMGYSEIENLWYAAKWNIQAFRNLNLKHHTTHTNLWCATKWNIQKLESETSHCTPVLRDMEYSETGIEILRTRDRNPIKRTQTEKDIKHPWTASLWISHCRCTFRADDLSSSMSSSKKKFLLKYFSNRFRQICFFPVSFRNQTEAMILRRANIYWNSFSG